MRTLIINFKNYPTILGSGSLDLARVAARVAALVRAEVIIAPPATELALVASKVKVKVFAQGISTSVGEKTTGAVIAEAVKAAGAVGTILNHSEARLRRSELGPLIDRLRKLDLDVCLCAEDSVEAGELAAFGTKYLAIEPPELIGSGVAVSKARPEVVSNTVRAARAAGFRGGVLCGAGIVDGADVAKAVELGADGVLVASSVTKSQNWESKVKELARSLG